MNDLLAYLELLIKAHQVGRNVGREVDEAVTAIRRELGLVQESTGLNAPKLDINELAFKYVCQHVTHHRLIEWSEVRSEPVVSHTARDYGNYGAADVSVREILNKLSTGSTVHQLCGEYNMDINQVAGAVTFAAYVVSNGKY